MASLEGIYRRKKEKNLGNFYFLRKIWLSWVLTKADFRTFFSTFYGQRSVAEPGPTSSPWSIGGVIVVVVIVTEEIKVNSVGV